MSFSSSPQRMACDGCHRRSMLSRLRRHGAPRHCPAAWAAPPALLTCCVGTFLKPLPVGVSLCESPLKRAPLLPLFAPACCACSPPTAALPPLPPTHAQDEEIAPSASLQSNLGACGAHWRWHAAAAASQPAPAAAGAAQKQTASRAAARSSLVQDMVA